MLSRNDYHSLLKYVYFEGYANSYKEAEDLLEELNDKEFDSLCEEVLYERSFYGKQPGQAIQTTGPKRSGGDTSSSGPDLDTMRARFKQADKEEEVEKASSKKTKEPTTVPSRGVAGNESAIRRRTPEGHRKRGASPIAVAQRRQRILSTGRDPNAKSSGGMVRQPTPESQARAKKIGAALRNKKNWGTKSEEYVLEYLVQEGYANSYENADTILQFMSDDWFEQILND